MKQGGGKPSLTGGRLTRVAPAVIQRFSSLVMRCLVGVALAGAGVALAAPAGPVIRVSGDHFVDAAGHRLRLQGVNLSGLEFATIHGWTPDAPWGGQTGTPEPDWSLFRSWAVNIVRIPLNEASWLGATCVDAAGNFGPAGAQHKADPGNNYQDAVRKAVANAAAHNLLVILDLHWSAPGNWCPLAQNPQADEDHSVLFWKQVATQFKGNPGVMFELFNEPFADGSAPGQDPWKLLRDGGSFVQFATGGNPQNKPYEWKAAGMQKLLTTIRETGADNVILAPGLNYTSDLSRWVQFALNDPRHQLAAAWHAYPKYGAAFGSAEYAQPNYGRAAFSAAEAIMAAGYPVLVTEFGDRNAPGTTSAPFASSLLPKLDAMGLGYLGWAWDTWKELNHVLISDATGTPSPGYGEYVKQHYLCRAAGTEPCR
jgi:endoglucanase